MARGLLHGATIMLLIGLVSVLFAMLSPMWLVLRTELEEKQCWYGEGIWTSRYYWGQDLPLARVKCQDPLGLGPLSTTRAYCDHDNHKPANKHDSRTYNHDMCAATNNAKITSSLACVFGALATIVCIIMGFAGGTSTSSTFWRWSLCHPFSRRQEFVATVFALACAFATIVFTLITCGIMLNSPLFSSSHRDALSKSQAGMPFKGFASCSFQTPMHSAFSLLSSGPMECLFAGPSFFATLIILICEGLACGFLAYLAHDIWVRRQYNMKRLGLEQPLLSGSTIAIASWNDEQMPYSTQQPRTRMFSDFVDEDQHDDVLPASFRKVRRYSMYGATTRRISKFGFCFKFCILTFAPVFFMVGNAVAWATYSMLGIQIIVAAEMSLLDRKQTLHHPMNGSFVYIPVQPPKLVQDQILQGFLDHIPLEQRGGDDIVQGFIRERKNFFRDIMNVFNFSPVTSLEYFWDNGAYLIAIAVFLSVLIIPIFKVVCWIWFFYAPSDEIIRGRVLDGLDFVGKYSLANLYVFCFLAITLCFDSDFIVIPLGDMSFLFRIRAAVNAGNGIGSYMYVLTSLLSLLIGQFMVWMHSLASAWEEDRRAKQGLSYPGQDTPSSLATTQTASTTGESGTPLLMTSILESPNYTVGDTPYMDSGMSSLGFAASVTSFPSNASELVLENSSRRSNDMVGGAGRGGGATSLSRVRFSDAPPTTAASAPRRSSSSLEILPMFRSLANFGSTVDLQRMGEGAAHRTGSGVQLATQSAAASVGEKQQQQQQQPDIMRALASFGSRTALNVLARQAQQYQRVGSNLEETIEEDEDEEGDEEQETEEDEEAGQYVDVRAERRPPWSAAALHPYVEAMCDRVHSPLQGTRLRWTPLGKVFVWILIFILAGFMLICQSWDLVEIHKKGIAGDIIVKPSQRYQLYSLVSFTGSVAETGYEVPAMELSTLFFIMTAVMPCLTVLGLAMMWTIPMTLAQQATLFTWLEIASAWSSLDIFFISIIAMYVELSDITDKIIADAVPKLTELIHILLPFEAGPMSADVKIKDGFWVLLVAVILEKVAIYLISEQAVTAISERRVEKFLRDLAKQSAKMQAASGEMLSPSGGSGSEGGSGSGGGQASGRIDTGLLGDAAEGLLETEAMLVFAPSGRYTSAMFPRTIYAGLPRTWWVRVLVRLGLLADAKTVERYYMTGEWFTLDSSHVPSASSTQDDDHDNDAQGISGPRPATRSTIPKRTKLTSPGLATGNNMKVSPLVMSAPPTTSAAATSTTATSTAQQQGKPDPKRADFTKRVSWGRLDAENDEEDVGRVSLGGEEDGPLSF